MRQEGLERYGRAQNREEVLKDNTLDKRRDQVYSKFRIEAYLKVESILSWGSLGEHPRTF